MDVLRLVPKHLAQNRPVVLCGGINVITGSGKPTFACKNFQVCSPREPDQPNDGSSSHRAVAARAAVRPERSLMFFWAPWYFLRGFR